MAVAPFAIQCKRDDKWVTIQTDELVPGDFVSVGACLALLAVIATHAEL